MPRRSTSEACDYNLQLAWKRLKSDRKNRCFIEHPFLLQLIEQELDEWLADIKGRLSDGFSPSPAVICYQPKPGWLLRPGCSLRIEDELVYTAIIGSILPSVESTLRWAKGNPDTSYLLQPNSNDVDWVSAGFRAWDDFRKKSLTAARRSEFIVSIDIAAFYENIDIARLISDVKNLGVNQNYINQLSTCLNRWAEPRGKGIPQGYSASDILAKLYLNSVDQAIRNEGFTHLRYVDDLRVFCTSLHEAKASLHLIIDRLRLRGLNVQSAKTQIMRADKAIADIDGVTPVIRSIGGDLADDLRRLGTSVEYNVSLQELARIVSENPETPSLDVLITAFMSHFVESEEEFDKTLFHYLLKRLGVVKARNAVDFCLKLLPRKPEETKFILKYFGDIECDQSMRDAIIKYVGSLDASNEFQIYEVLKFFYEQGFNSNETLILARRLVRDRNRPLWLRTYAYAIVGRLGTVADLEHIESLYSVAENEVEKADIICALYRVEQSRRNAILARAMDDGYLVKRAINFVRQGNIC